MLRARTGAAFSQDHGRRVLVEIPEHELRLPEHIRSDERHVHALRCFAENLLLHAMTGAGMRTPWSARYAARVTGYSVMGCWRLLDEWLRTGVVEVVEGETYRSAFGKAGRMYTFAPGVLVLQAADTSTGAASPSSVTVSEPEPGESPLTARNIGRCERCGGELEQRRSTRRTCSDACRQAAYRARRARVRSGLPDPAVPDVLAPGVRVVLRSIPKFPS